MGGKVTGWLDETDVDSQNQPAFISKRTGKPGRLFHINFTDGDIIFQDLEEHETRAILVEGMGKDQVENDIQENSENKEYSKGSKEKEDEEEIENEGVKSNTDIDSNFDENVNEQNTTSSIESGFVKNHTRPQMLSDDDDDDDSLPIKK